MLVKNSEAELQPKDSHQLTVMKAGRFKLRSRRFVDALCVAFVSVLWPCDTAWSQQGSFYDAVDPFIGTSGGGLTSPAASLPFGMIQWGPSTNKSDYYFRNDRTTYGFSLTHLNGVGCPVGADVPILPWSDEPRRSPGVENNTYEEFIQTLEHATEEAHPGYYAITLGNGVKVELTVNERAGMARFSFPPGINAAVLVKTGESADTDVHMAGLPSFGRENNKSLVEVLDDNALTGWATSWGFCVSPAHYSLHIAAKFDVPYRRFDTWHDNQMQRNQRLADGKQTGAWLDFGDRHEVLMKIGLSYISEAGALANLNTELPEWNFDAIRARGRESWTRALNHISVEGGSADQYKIFATAVYHILLTPTLFNDDDGNYLGFDQKVHSLTGSKQAEQYANFSDWDTYRNTLQLQALLVPKVASDMMQSLVNDAVQGGWIPRWPLANQSTYEMGVGGEIRLTFCWHQDMPSALATLILRLHCAT